MLVSGDEVAGPEPEPCSVRLPLPVVIRLPSSGPGAWKLQRLPSAGVRKSSDRAIPCGPCRPPVGFGIERERSPPSA